MAGTEHKHDEHAHHKMDDEMQQHDTDHHMQEEHKGHDMFEHSMHNMEMDHSSHGAEKSHLVHDEHAGHGTNHTGHEQMFRTKFWGSLLLSIPVLVFSPTLQNWLGFSIPSFAGSEWISFVFALKSSFVKVSSKS